MTSPPPPRWFSRSRESATRRASPSGADSSSARGGDTGHLPRRERGPRDVGLESERPGAAAPERMSSHRSLVVLASLFLATPALAGNYYTIGEYATVGPLVTVSASQSAARL